MTTDDLSNPPSMRPDLDALAAFLVARLDEDEAAARSLLLSGEILPFESIAQAADHRARYGPLRVLREVHAKRAVVRRWREGSHVQRHPQAGPPDAAAALMAVLASVFADHPDFDSTWLAAVDERGDEPDNVVPLPGF